jgi:gluconolactonase
MPGLLAAMLTLGTLAVGQAPAGDDRPAHPGAVAILPAGAKLEKLYGDGEFTEGPVEAPDGGILFSDIGNRILRFNPTNGTVATFREPSGRANGLILTPDGRLVAAEGANAGGGRRVSITAKDGTVSTLADRFEGKRLNSPNDVAVDAAGRVYVSDPRYVGDDPRELDVEAVYRIDPDGAVHRLDTTARKPNGLVVSPDGKTLYVADNGPTRKVLLAVPIDDKGNVAGRPKVLKDYGNGRGIDGMTITVDGKIVATAGNGPLGGVYVYEPDGTPVAFLATPESPTNCELAGPGGNVLYITAGKGLYRIHTTLRGYRPGTTR